MEEEIIIPMRKLQKKNLLNPIDGHTKTMKLLFTELNTKYNALVL
jgi:hypothetical protein